MEKKVVRKHQPLAVFVILFTITYVLLENLLHAQDRWRDGLNFISLKEKREKKSMQTTALPLIYKFRVTCLKFIGFSKNKNNKWPGAAKFGWTKGEEKRNPRTSIFDLWIGILRHLKSVMSWSFQILHIKQMSAGLGPSCSSYPFLSSSHRVLVRPLIRPYPLSW